MFFFVQLFLTFFMVQVFQGSCFPWSVFFRVHVFQGLGFYCPSFSGSRFSRSRFFRVQVFVGPGFWRYASGVYVQVLEVANLLETCDVKNIMHSNVVDTNSLTILFDM